MSNIIKLNKGLNINLQGVAEQTFDTAAQAETYALKPTDFYGLTPKVAVKEGDHVKAGEPLFFDKNHAEIKFVSPVSGTVSAVTRGDKRKLLHVAVKADGSQESVKHNVGNIEQMSRDEVLNLILEGGVFPFFIQRPYGVIANPADTPRDIFVSCFDSSPLAFDFEFALQGEEANFQKGIDVLAKLAGKPVKLGISKKQQSGFFAKTQNAQITVFEGAHPAGNVGVQINHVAPINKGEVIWTIKPQQIVIIGRLFNTGVYDASCVTVLAGTGVEKPCYYKTLIGAPIKIFASNIKQGDYRIVCGSVLSGTRVSNDDYVGTYDDKVCVIPEGDHNDELLGWAKPVRASKFSMSHSYFSWLMPAKKYNLDTNYNGDHRAFVMSGQYEKVLPMDIYPVYLLKAILANDIDKMEQLGIYEVIEEDLALCEFVCTSKTDVQQILRQGINAMIKEM